jgi:hypothetical protein
MNKRLPPLNPLRAIEATARLGSLTTLHDTGSG